jgi:hypothetical protein
MANVQGSKPYYFVGQFGDGKAKGNLAYAQDGKGNSVKGLQFDDGNGNKMTALDLKGDSKFLNNPKMQDNLNKFLGDKGKQGDKGGADGGNKADQDKNPMGDLIGKLAEGLFGKDNPLTKALQGAFGGNGGDKAAGDAGGGAPQQLADRGGSGGGPGGGSPFGDLFKDIGGSGSRGGSDRGSGPPNRSEEVQA